MLCPLCSADSRFSFNTKGYSINDCLSCGHRFTALSADEKSVLHTYNLDYFSAGGAGYSGYDLEEESLVNRGRYYSKIVSRFGRKTGRMLDVGAAAGFILRGFIENGWTGVGIEPNYQIAEIGREKYNLNIISGTLESFVTDEQFDLISMIQVAAHFYSPQKAFNNANSLLKENGLLLVETWDRTSLTARLFGKHWHEYAPPTVLHFFSEIGLSKFLQQKGFEIIARGIPSRTISGLHAKSLLKFRLGELSVLNLIPDKISIPYLGRDLFWAIYRKIG